MRNFVIGLAVIGLLASTVGCANGPLRRMFRGAPCNTCNPPIGQPLGENFVGGCNTGTCSNGAVGNGILGGIFRNGQQQAAAPPVSLPASSFSNAPTIAPTSAPSELYGNTVNAGQLELPPNSPFN